MQLGTLAAFALVLILASCAHTPGAAPDAAAQAMRPPDQLPSIPELPDPFKFQDGSRVTSRADWTRRRAELVRLVQYYEYGQLPPAPTGGVKVTEIASSENHSIRAWQKTLLLETVANGKPITVRMEVIIPLGHAPWPVIVEGDLCWGRLDADILTDAAHRGYAIVQFDRTDITPDAHGRDTGLLAAYPDLDTGCLAAWAWGYARIVDWLETQPWVDKEKIIFTGHSRGGKATLLAGAMDTRAALVNPNDSGCGGAGCYRLQAPKSEDIVAITKNFPYWFNERFRQFIGDVDRLPFDQHSVKALVAPRAYLSTEAKGDLWANPEGTLKSHLAAKEVWDFLGASDRIGIHYREGGHKHTRADWNWLMDFADKVLKGKPTDTKFDNYPYPTTPRPYSWTRP